MPRKAHRLTRAAREFVVVRRVNRKVRYQTAQMDGTMDAMHEQISVLHQS
jgi:hypothetical protein